MIIARGIDPDLLDSYTREEIVAAYLADGYPPDDAEAFAAVLKSESLHPVD